MNLCNDVWDGTHVTTDDLTSTTGIDVLDSTVAIVTTEQVITRITIWPNRGQSKTLDDEAGQWQQPL